MHTRRAVIGATLGSAVALSLAESWLPSGRQLVTEARAATGVPPRPRHDGGRLHEWSFVAQERDVHLLGEDKPASKIWSYAETLMPVRRVRIGDTIRAHLVNRLPEHTSIHWHGVRVPNAMDGVPFVTQPPVLPGESFLYELTPPDTGAFFFHPHCNEAGQVGRGLTGILIVEGDEQVAADADIVMAVKDWRLDPDGRWLDFETSDGASRAGTFGTVRAVNGSATLKALVPAHGDVRIRVLNLDSTRQMQLGVDGADAALIATDGNAIEPIALDRLQHGAWRLAPAMRVDLLVRSPAAGRAFTVYDYFGARPYALGRFSAVASSRHERPFDPPSLYGSTVPRANLQSAERLTFEFSAAPGSPAALTAELPDDHPLKPVLLDSLCVGDRTFWAINKQTWPASGHHKLPPPLARLKAGQSYVFELVNATPHPHPIHLHGHTFEVLSASRQKLPRFLADTVLVQPRERIEIAFVAAPGNWMFHCHVLEHMETGMMGWLSVT